MHDIDHERFDRTIAQCWQMVEHRPKLPQHKNFELAWLQKQTEKPKQPKGSATLDAADSSSMPLAQ
jgi:hypothetical protein